jgi:translation initiation factor 2 subunit 1
MAKMRDFPEEGELVVGTVKTVQNFGAFITLEEYPGREGFCHIREVAAGWVKRIRDHVREQQRVVCKVMGVDSKKGHIDLSLKAVNDHQRREAIQTWKNEQKADKLVEMLAERQKTTVEKLMKAYGNQLVEVWGGIYPVFQGAAEYGRSVFDDEGIKGDWIDDFVEFSKENIQAQFVEVVGFVDVHSNDPEGVDKVRGALAAAEKSEFDDVQIKVTYLGAPRYRLLVQAPDFKIAEDELRKAAERAVTTMKKNGGEGAFHRELEEAK